MRWGQTARERLAERNTARLVATTMKWECCATGSCFEPIPQSFLHVVEQRPQLAGAGWVTQFTQSLGFDLAYTFPGDVERLADFFQCVFRTIVHPKTHADDLLFPRAEGPQHVRREDH